MLAFPATCCLPVRTSQALGSAVLADADALLYNCGAGWTEDAGLCNAHVVLGGCVGADMRGWLVDW